MPSPIGDGKSRPLYTYCLLMVESTTGSVVGRIQRNLPQLDPARKNMFEFFARGPAHP
jgi:hypothetical protein